MAGPLIFFSFFPLHQQGCCGNEPKIPETRCLCISLPPRTWLAALIFFATHPKKENERRVKRKRKRRRRRKRGGRRQRRRKPFKIWIIPPQRIRQMCALFKKSLLIFAPLILAPCFSISSTKSQRCFLVVNFLFMFLGGAVGCSIWPRATPPDLATATSCVFAI